MKGPRWTARWCRIVRGFFRVRITLLITDKKTANLCTNKDLSFYYDYQRIPSTFCTMGGSLGTLPIDTPVMSNCPHCFLCCLQGKLLSKSFCKGFWAENPAVGTRTSGPVIRFCSVIEDMSIFEVHWQKRERSASSLAPRSLTVIFISMESFL